MIGNKTISIPLEEEKIGKLLWQYSIPAIVGTLSNALYNVIDRIYIGQGVGAMAISGLALTFPLMALFGAFGMLIGSGSAARISIFLGEKDINKAENVLGNALILSIVLSAIVYSLSYIFLDEILVAFGGTPNTIEYAKEFMQIIIPGQVFSTIALSFNNMIRASGYPVKAMITMLSGAVLNIILAPIFIFVFDMGIRGAAIATIISMIISSIWVMTHFFSSRSYVRFRKENFRLNKGIILSIFSIGLSPFLMQIAASCVNILMNHSLKNYGGDLAIGAFGIMNSLMVILVFTVVGLNQGMQPIIGYNYGARRYDRMSETLKYGIVIGTIITSFGFLMAMFIPELAVSAFTTDSVLKSMSANGLRIAMGAYLFVGFQVVTTNFFQSIGKVKISIFLSLTRQVIFLIPCLLLLPRVFGLDGVWFSMPISDMLASALSAIALYHFVKK